MSRRERRPPVQRVLAALATGIAVLAAACGEDDPGPGMLELAVADGVSVGGLVVELSGEGIVGVRGGAGVSVVAGAPTSTGGGVPELRVVAVQEVAGPMTLQIEVARADGPLPGTTLVQASDADDALIPSYRLPELRLRRLR